MKARPLGGSFLSRQAAGEDGRKRVYFSAALLYVLGDPDALEFLCNADKPHHWLVRIEGADDPSADAQYRIERQADGVRAVSESRQVNARMLWEAMEQYGVDKIEVPEAEDAAPGAGKELELDLLKGKARLEFFD